MGAAAETLSRFIDINLFQLLEYGNQDLNMALHEARDYLGISLGRGSFITGISSHES